MGDAVDRRDGRSAKGAKETPTAVVPVLALELPPGGRAVFAADLHLGREPSPSVGHLAEAVAALSAGSVVLLAVAVGWARRAADRLTSHQPCSAGAT